MAFVDDLVTLWEADGLGTLGSTIFIGTKSAPPILASGATLTVVATGGTGPELTHNNTTFPSYLRPTAQVVARANGPAAALDLADEAFASCAKVRNQLIGDNWYLDIQMVQSEPFDLGLDARSQIRYAFNVLARVNRRIP